MSDAKLSSKERLYDEAFSLLQRAQALLERAQKRHTELEAMNTALIKGIASLDSSPDEPCALQRHKAGDLYANVDVYVAVEVDACTGPPPEAVLPEMFTREQVDQMIAAAVDVMVADAARNAPPSASKCICKGNWRLIVEESKGQIGQMFTDHAGKEFSFFGLVHGGDDYYYGMYRRGEDRLGETRLLSCVGSLETHGYSPVTKSEGQS